jgi:hypothetical protein
MTGFTPTKGTVGSYQKFGLKKIRLKLDHNEDFLALEKLGKISYFPGKSKSHLRTKMSISPVLIELQTWGLNPKFSFMILYNFELGKICVGQRSRSLFE